MPKRKEPPALTRRERQIMDVIYRRGQAAAGEIQAEMVDAPSYSTVRTLLRVLTEKGHVEQTSDGTRHVYSPVVPRQTARRRALETLIATFFDGSAEKAVVTLVDMASTRLSPEELDRLQSLIDHARQGKNR